MTNQQIFRDLDISPHSFLNKFKLPEKEANKCLVYELWHCTRSQLAKHILVAENSITGTTKTVLWYKSSLYPVLWKNDSPVVYCATDIGPDNAELPELEFIVSIRAAYVEGTVLCAALIQHKRT